MEKLLTTEELAKILQVQPRTIVVWRTRKEGPPWIRLGTGGRAPVRYREQDVNEWFDGQLQEAGR